MPTEDLSISILLRLSEESENSTDVLFLDESKPLLIREEKKTYILNLFLKSQKIRTCGLKKLSNLNRAPSSVLTCAGMKG